MDKSERLPKVRYRFSVCPNNEAVIAWIDSQYDLSASISKIVLDAIQTYGYKDVMANDTSSVGKVKRGRPPKQSEEDISSDDYVDYDEIARKVAILLSDNNSEPSRDDDKKQQIVKKEKPVESSKPAGASPTAMTAASFFGEE